jgi:hypothetical protein
MNVKEVTIMAVFLVFISTGHGWASSPVAVSPGDVAGPGMTDQACPTFSWSSADGAVSYRIEVYEKVAADVLPRDTMSAMATPIFVKNIAAPALSWTLPSNECLARGINYVWYVHGVGEDGEGQWSEGRVFQVEVWALSLEQEQAVQEIVKEYLEKDAARATSLSTAGPSRSSGITVTTSSGSPASTDPVKDPSVRTAQSAASAGVQIPGDLAVQGTVYATSLSGLTTPLSIAQGGTGSNTKNFYTQVEVDALLAAQKNLLSPRAPVLNSGQQITYATGDDGNNKYGATVTGSRFTDNGDGTVTDNLTGLIWLKDANCIDTVGGIAKPSGFLYWAEALTWSNNLASGLCDLIDGSIAGSWRLPNINELQSLVDYSKSGPALPAVNLFSNVQSQHYWSSTTYAPDTAGALSVYMSSGGVSSGDKTFVLRYVWPVRGGR